ncbi:MAG: amino acid ABC transporter substrate-binding protein [Azoarcus sp.]|jgi:glutamate/aspartate transport system substrate-binding protein|nr:amino acid ABC transporter substrate-binding protein [Azoarcus sp.]
MNTSTLATAIAACAATCLLLAAPVWAQDGAAARKNQETIEKIRQSGAIILSYRLANMPFTYLDSSFEPTGYAKELCDHVVDSIRREYDMPQLKIIYLPVVAKNRISALQNGAIDLECGSSTDNPERRKAVDFSITYFISNIRLLTRKDYRFVDLNSLRGKTVVVTTGTTAEKAVSKLNVAGRGIKVLYGRTHSDSFLMVKSGRAYAYLMDDILLAGLISASRDPNAYEIVGPSLSTERYAIMLRKEDARLKTIVNKTLAHLMSSGEAAKLYERWFMRPIPPSGIVINLPMSDELTQVFAHPTAASWDSIVPHTSISTP